jgi:DNA-binding response OmpR family regulator
MKQRILLIEDDPAIRAGLEMNLRVDGYDSATASDGFTGRNMIYQERWDLILLDLMLPKVDGLELLRELREKGLHTPVIVLSARGQEIDKVAALEMGADDYVSKPFGLAELLSRIRAVLRRGAAGPSYTTLRFGSIEIDPARREVRKSGALVDLTAKEFDLLFFLVKHPDRVFSRQQLLNEVWDIHYEGTARTVDNFIAQLRSKLEDKPDEPQMLLTVRGIGYRFSANP